MHITRMSPKADMLLFSCVNGAADDPERAAGNTRHNELENDGAGMNEVTYHPL